MVTGWAEVDDREQVPRGRRRLFVLLTAAVVVPCLLLGSLALAADKHRSERLRLHGIALTGRTWYLTSVTRLGRTWVPQGLSTLRFPNDHTAVTFDGASTSNWAVNFGGGTLRTARHGEQEAGAGGPVSYQIGQAVEAVLKGHTALSLLGDDLSLTSSRGTLHYASAAPRLAPTATISMQVDDTTSGTTRTVPATLAVHDADGLELWESASPAAGATLGDLASGSYTITATTTRATCRTATVSVTSGQTVAATVVCRS